jgi:hypothetical protein
MDYMEFLEIAIFVLASAGVSLVIRFWDYPETKIQGSLKVDIFKTYFGALIAVAFALWVMMFEYPDIDIFTPVLFANMAGVGVGGMAAFRALMNKVAPGAGI